MSTERPPVTNIIFGTMTLGYQGYGSRVHDSATAAAMLNMYSDAGYRALDTAHAYGGGSGEQMLGDLGAAGDTVEPNSSIALRNGGCVTLERASGAQRRASRRPLSVLGGV
jgi:diketogulonate reductase-like aldo/keto reductase